MQGPVATKRAANDARFKDAAPKTLYVSRRLLNAADLIAWAKKPGLRDDARQPIEMHVTICYSRQAVDWMKIGQDWSSDKDGKLTVPGRRAAHRAEIRRPKGAIVLLFGVQRS
jgi:hypothetical protein